MGNRLVQFSCFSYYACAALAGCGSAASTQAPAGVDAGLPAAHDAGTRSQDVAWPTVSRGSPPAAPADAGRRAPPSSSTVVDAASDAGGRTGPSCVPEAGDDLPDDDFIDSNCDGIDGDASAAVFVAPSGSDDAAGTMAAPVQTLKRAIDLATSAAKNVYVCNGEYDEAVHFQKTGVSLYGGYDCARKWERVRDRATVSPKSGVPFTANGVANAIVVERLAFKAPDGTGVAASSIAASIVDSAKIAFRGVLFVAGNATDGAAGAAGHPIENGAGPIPAWPGWPATALQGAKSCEVTYRTANLAAFSDPNCGQLPSGGSGPTLPCPDGSQVLGGAGGDGINLALPDTHFGRDGMPSSGANVDGSTGENGVPGRPALRGFGEVVGGVYIPDNDGQNGNWGHSGQSGKGGDGGNCRLGSTTDVTQDYTPGGGGGQGGYGGCGGAGGGLGHGGGASLGVVIVRSTVSIVESTIQTGRGGNGGAGGDGGSGQVGGQPGAGASGPGFPGMPGGKGGNGGNGGAGGPGGGGPSIGVVWSDTAPSFAHVTFALGTPGHGGTSHDLNATDGVSGDSLSLAAIATMGSAGNP